MNSRRHTDQERKKKAVLSGFGPLPRLRVSVVVWGGACVPGFGCGLALESVHGGWGWF